MGILFRGMMRHGTRNKPVKWILTEREECLGSVGGVATGIEVETTRQVVDRV